jgi:hypothetical protein
MVAYTGIYLPSGLENKRPTKKRQTREKTKRKDKQAEIGGETRTSSSFYWLCVLYALLLENK